RQRSSLGNLRRLRQVPAAQGYLRQGLAANSRARTEASISIRLILCQIFHVRFWLGTVEPPIMTGSLCLMRSSQRLKNMTVSDLQIVSWNCTDVLRNNVIGVHFTENVGKIIPQSLGMLQT
ncbi:scorpion toxin-like knottin superfamily protein, partial [Striga asiatica]